MAFTASQACAQLFALIEQVNDDHVSTDIVSKNGRAAVRRRVNLPLTSTFAALSRIVTV